MRPDPGCTQRSLTRSMIVSNGTSKLTTTLTGVSFCKAAAWGWVRGNPKKNYSYFIWNENWHNYVYSNRKLPSNNHGSVSSFFNSEEIRLTITSSGTKAPLSIKFLASRPRSVPSLICWRKISPELTCFKPKSRTIQLEIVPLPDPGAPKTVHKDKISDAIWHNSMSNNVNPFCFYLQSRRTPSDGRT